MTTRSDGGWTRVEDGKRKYFTWQDAEKKEGDCFTCENAGKVEAWEGEYKRQYAIQWPVFWADTMLKERAK